MNLFFSDLHLGRSDSRSERAVEADLIACLRAYEADAEALFLVGDVFDQYIEYRYLVPKGFVRFQALLAEWTDRGVPVTYVVGNHDPWHSDYFEQELGVTVIFDQAVETIDGTAVYISHGDGIAGCSRLYNVLKPVLRHPLPVGLYRSLLPGDSGFGLAKWVNRAIRQDEPADEAVDALRAYARRMLETNEANLVVMGHCHRAEHTVWPEGQYLNTGCWYSGRTFGRLSGGKVELLQWNSNCALPVDQRSSE